MTEHTHQSVSNSLQAAEAVCQERGQRFTPLRKRVLELILEAGKPVKAYELLEQLSQDRARVAPPTVYRSLEFLLEQKFLHRIESQNAFIACCAGHGHRHAVQFFICSECNEVIEMSDDGIAATIKDRAAELGFQAHRQTIEVSGLCQRCQAGA
jgi:Fur family zinc uptake transcriptional regulator